LIYPPHLCTAVKLLQRDTPKFITDFWPLNSRNLLNPVDCRIWACQFKMWPIWDGVRSRHGIACHSALWTMLLTNGGRDFRPVWMKKENILNTCCSSWSWTRTGCADKLDVVLDCATVMCNFGWYVWKLSLCTWLVF